MALSLSRSSLLLHPSNPKTAFRSSTPGRSLTVCIYTNKNLSLTSDFRPPLFTFSVNRRPNLFSRAAAPASESAVEVELGGGGDGFDSGGGGNNNNGKGNNGGGDNKGEGEGEPEKKKMAMSMSQKLTLGYAALVGVGGVMGYLKSGSQKSLAAGGLSALLLVYVYNELPVRPALASLLGFGLSAVLVAVMGTRFKKSKKIFPAGVVSIVSFIMAGGYLHGVFRSL